MLLRNFEFGIWRAIHNLSSPKVRPSGAELYCALAFIWAVTCLDVWCCQWLQVQFELNPLARWIMLAGGDGGLWVIVAARIAGTALSVEIARLFCRPVIYSLVITQIICLGFLCQ